MKFGALVLMTGTLLFSAMSLVLAESSPGEKYRVDPVTNQQYKDECGACHFAYQPGLLPTNSWRKVMDNLAEHFGDNAELSEVLRQDLLEYLENNSADNSNAYLSLKVMRSLPRTGTITKISKIGFIAREHDGISRRMVASESPGLSNCNDCHQLAEEGSYNESEIRIPEHNRRHD